jgi:ribosomal protein L37E
MFPAMGTKRLDTFNDCQRHGVRVWLTCRRCGRSRYVSPFGDPIFQDQRIRENMSPHAVARHLKCGRCGAKMPKVDLRMPV